MNPAQRQLRDADTRARAQVRALVIAGADPDQVVDAVHAHTATLAELRARLGLTRQETAA